MDVLPWHLMNEIFFRIDRKSLAMIQCTNKSLNIHISNDPYFESEYFSRARSCLFHISTYGSKSVCYNPLIDSRARTTNAINLMECLVLASCSGLILLDFIGGLCVANPFTRMFRFINYSVFSPPTWDWENSRMYTGLSVDRIDRTVQRFSLVCVREVYGLGQTTYTFVIYDGYSWRFSKTHITCDPSNLNSKHMKRPVYFDGFLHWLREDGSIVAFNPKTEHARLIHVKLPNKPCAKTLFASGGNSLNLIRATYKEIIYVYALKDHLVDPKWVLVRRFPNIRVKKAIYWNLEAYDGKCLLLREETCKGDYDRVIHRYDLGTNKWEVMDSIPWWCDANQEFFLYTPWTFRVIGLDDNKKIILHHYGKYISSLNTIMSLIDGVASKKILKKP